mgnify:CR=1 FL=1
MRFLSALSGFAWLMVLLFLMSILTPLQQMEQLEHETDSSMSAGARTSPDLIVDYISASWSSADAGDSKSVSVRIEDSQGPDKRGTLGETRTCLLYTSPSPRDRG